MKLLLTALVMFLASGSAFSEGPYNPGGVAKPYIPRYSNGGDVFLRKDLHQPFQTLPSDGKYRPHKGRCRKVSRRCGGGKPVERGNSPRSVLRH